MTDDYFNPLVLAKCLWCKKKFIIKTVVIFGLLGTVVAILAPKTFTSGATIVPQMSSGQGNMGGLSSLAALAGFNLNMEMDGQELSPLHYPKIVESIPFQLEMMNSQFEIGGRSMSLYEYYIDVYEPGVLSYVKKYTIGLPKELSKAIRGVPKEIFGNSMEGERTTVLTQNQERVREILSQNIILDINDKEGYFNLSATMPEALLSAKVAERALELLQKKIIDFKIQKAKSQFEFIEERTLESKSEFEKAQSDLAAFRDRNRNISSAVARTEEERLESNYQLTFEVFKQLAQQLEQANIKIKEDTPVFAVLKPVNVPLVKSNPNRPLILFIWCFLGLVISLGWVFGCDWLHRVKDQWYKI